MVEESESEPPEEEYEHSEQDEEQKTREQLKNKFQTLATSIKVLTDNSLDLLEKGRREVFNEEVYVNFTHEQDVRFDEELSRINETIAQAQTVLDILFRPEKSMPKFENFQNVFYELYINCIKTHTEGLFYQGHVAKESKYLYPYFPIRIGLRNMRQLISRVAGVLSECGDYFTHPVSISIGSGGGGNSESSEDYYYRTGRQPAREQGQVPAQARYKDIGAP